MKKIVQFFLVVISLLVIFGSAVAGAEDVDLLKIRYYDYGYLDAFGQYQKCSSVTTWFMVVVQNGTTSSYTLKMPSEVSITGWYGTKHPMGSFTYATMQYGDTDAHNGNLAAVPFNGTVVLSPYTSLVIRAEIGDIDRYNLYWDTDVFFNIMIDNTALPVRGLLMQRGNGCPENEVCTADIIDGGYNSDGGNGLLTVKIDNKMQDTAYITADKSLKFVGVTSAGEAWEDKLTNVVTWDSPSFALSSGGTKTLTGTFTLPTELAGVNDSLDLTAYFTFPSSLFFGNISATKTLSTRGGVHGIMTAHYASNGSSGQLTASLTNHLNEPVTVSKPASGIIKSNSASSTVDFNWAGENRLQIDAESSVTIEGTFSFDKPAIAQSNNALVISSDFPFAGATTAGSTFAASGSATRDADPNPTISSLGLCRDYKLNDKTVYIEYSMRNNSSIDIPAQLATTLAVENNVANSIITYSGCESYPNGNGAMEACISRIDSSSNIVIKPGEVVKVKGTVSVTTAPDTMDKFVSTALVYFPDGVRTVLFVGNSTASCEDFAETEVPSPTATTESTDVPLASSTPEITATPEATDEPPLIDPDVTDTPESTPSATAEVEPEVTPTEEGSEVILSAVSRNGSYSSCAAEKAVSFTYSIQNDGTAAAALDVNKVYFFTGDDLISGVTYTACRLQDSSGVDPTCFDKINQGALTIFPGQTLSLEASWLPADSIQAESFSFIGRSREYASIDFEVTATKSNDYCGTAVEPVKDESGNAVHGNAGDGSGQLPSLNITLVNNSNDDSKILPQNIYLQTAYITGYSAAGEITANSEKSIMKSSLTIVYGEEFTLPANSTIFITLPINPNSAGMPQGAVDVNWNFKIGNTAVNYSGSIDLPTAVNNPPVNTVIPTEPATPVIADTPVNSDILPVADIPVSSLIPTAEATPDNINQNLINTTGPVSMSAIPNIFWKEEQSFANMPGTGFAAGKRTILPAQPAMLEYNHRNGLHIEIPRLNSSTDIVEVPLNEDDNWAVDWLGERAAMLENTVIPGEGTSIIAGHNHIDTGHAGPFAYLNQLESNDRIFVTNDQNKLQIYRVYANQLIEPQDGDSIYQNAIPGSLVLITCEAEKPEGGYAYRRLVFAEPMQ